MLKALVWSVALLSATTAMADQVARPAAKPVPAKVPAKPVPAKKVKVTMIAATLADDCGGTAPHGPPPVPTPAPASKPAITASADAALSDDEPGPSNARGASSAKRRCLQTSMQLSVVAPAGVAPGKLKVTKVELFDDTGASLGELKASNPRVWTTAKSQYQAWDEAVAGGTTLSVSYALTRPAWSPSASRHNKTYTLKATVTIGGSSQTFSREAVNHIEVPTILPPDVQT